jgi:hypothetical protein
MASFLVLSSDPLCGSSEATIINDRLHCTVVAFYDDSAIALRRQTSSTGSARGVTYENVHVWLKLPRQGYTNDVEIALALPNTEAVRI